MGKVAFMFPGQGAQYIGMGKDFYENEAISRKIFDKASKVVGLDIPALCFEENDRLDKTEFTQVAMVATEVAVLEALKERGIHPHVTAGLSLGEYSAIVAAGAMRAEDAFAVVRRRGIYMQEAVPTGGAMAAVLGIESTVVEKVCRDTEGTVSIANYNCPGQVVITGEADAVDRAADALKESGAKRIVPLNVSGPFHSPMLTQAGERLAKDLEKVQIIDFSTPYVTNLTAEYVDKAEPVRGYLKMQISSPVMWQQSVERMLDDGVDIFVEIGPGRTLSSFVRKISRKPVVVNIDHYGDLSKAMEVLANA